MKKEIFEINDIDNLDDWCKITKSLRGDLKAIVRFPNQVILFKKEVFEILIKAIIIRGDARDIIFEDCLFNFEVSLNYDLEQEENNKEPENYFNEIPSSPLKLNEPDFGSIRMEYINCDFQSSLSFDDYEYNEKIRFFSCTFSELKIKNAKFNSLFEIIDCEVFSNAVFNKVDFFANCVFTKTKFHKNCIFTYSTFEKQGIFSRAIFKDHKNRNTGLDLSQSIINGQLTFFDTVLENYDSVILDSLSKEYDDAIKDGKVIPIQNKRETFRIIKHQLLQQNNVIGAEKYAKLEKQTLLEEKNLDAIYEYNVLKTFKILLSDYFVLKLNKYSNNFKTSWLYAFIFTLSIAFISHSFLSISKNYEFDDFTKLIKLINITDFSFYEKEDISPRLYTAYFLAKISIGFGIYQLIQAFRKYK